MVAHRAISSCGGGGAGSDLRGDLVLPEAEEVEGAVGGDVIGTALLIARDTTCSLSCSILLSSSSSVTDGITADNLWFVWCNTVDNYFSLKASQFPLQCKLSKARRSICHGEPFAMEESEAGSQGIKMK